MTDQSARDAIESGSLEQLRALLDADPSLARRNIEWGPNNKNVVPPLHYCCDVVFRKLATQEQAASMADALIEAGADIHESYAKSGDTFLISAASLGAELIGLRLVELGADVHAQGLFGATALHWSAFMGLPRLVAALVEAGAPTDLPDKNYGSTPLGWAQHAWAEGCNGYHDQVPACAMRLGGSVDG
jgi:ankyrin repeat protein